MSEARRILLEAAVILFLGMAVGLSANYRLVLNAFSGRVPVVVAPEPGSRFPLPAALEEVRQLLAGGAVAVDARAPELFGEGHLPGARSLPLGEFDTHFDAFRAAVPLGAVVIAYCSGYGCPDSFDLGVRLLGEGYRDVRVFEGGFPEWRDAALPVEGTP